MNVAKFKCNQKYGVEKIVFKTLAYWKRLGKLMFPATPACSSGCMFGSLPKNCALDVYSGSKTNTTICCTAVKRQSIINKNPDSYSSYTQKIEYPQN